MRAEVDDELVVKSRRLDEPTRRGQVLEARGPDGTPPFLVRWNDSGHTALVFPGPDADVIHTGRHQERAAEA
jgi:hypothetical protein